ncbi:MAG: rod shape-determining protein MreD [bacterium]
MRWIPFLLLAVAAVLVQSTVGRVAGAWRPQVLVAVLVPVCLGARRGDGFAAGCVLGLARDLFSAEPFGLSAGLFALLGYGLARLRPNVYAEHPLTHALFALGCSAVSSAASVAALLLQGGVVRTGSALGRAGATAVATALLSGLVGWLLWRRPKWWGLRRGAGFSSL